MRSDLRLVPLLLLVPALFLAPVAAARPVPPLERRDVKVAPPPARQALAVTGTFGVAGGVETRLLRTVELKIAADGTAVALPLAAAAKGRGHALTTARGPDGSVERRTWEAHFTGAEGPVQAAAVSPLLQLYDGCSLSADVVTLGPPTADGGVHPPAGGLWGTAWQEDEDPVVHALYQPADLDLVPVLAVLGGTWAKEQERTWERRVERPEGLPAWTQRTSVHYMGVREGRTLFEFEVVTQGAFFDAGPPTTLDQRSVGTLLLAADGSLTHARVERKVDARDDERHVRSTASTVELAAFEGEAPAPGDAARFAEALALRRSDPAAFGTRLFAETTDTARRLVLAIRPDVPLDDVTVRLWDDRVDIGALVREAHQLADSPLAFDILEEHGPTFEALGVLAPATIEELRRQVPGGSAGVPWAIAFALPSKKLVLVKPDHVSEPALIAHEFAHVISDAKGYVDRKRIGLDSAEKLDLAFVDVDGAIAAWALEEAQAEVTEEAVRSQIGHPLTFGFAIKAYAASVGEPGEKEDLFQHLLHLLYRASPRVVAAAYERGDTVEKTIARAFQGYSYRTRQILFPGAESPASTLFPAARALRGQGPVGATRVGAFGILQALFRSRDLSYRQAREMVRALADDVVLRYPDGDLWITRWTDEASAKAFADAWRLPQAPADEHLDVRGDAVVFVKGTVPDAEARIADLLAAAR